MELKYKILLKLQRNENPVDVGIISFNINSATYNFGAALHSYAFQQFLNKLGIQNVIINYYAKTTKYNFITQKIIQNFKDKQFLTLTKNLFYGFFIQIFLSGCLSAADMSLGFIQLKDVIDLIIQIFIDFL